MQNKTYTSSFKFKVVLELMRGDATIAEIISKYQVSKSVIHKWKKQFLDNGENIFRDKNQQEIKENHYIEKLHATIGRERS